MYIKLYVPESIWGYSYFGLNVFVSIDFFLVYMSLWKHETVWMSYHVTFIQDKNDKFLQK
jgi:hypothetical protein